MRKRMEVEEGDDGFVLMDEDTLENSHCHPDTTQDPPDTTNTPLKRPLEETTQEGKGSEKDGRVSLGLELEATYQDSKVPEKCLGNVPCCMGIDEAGRGPVLGPMVYGAAYWPIAESDSINKLGFNDSKQLSSAQRSKFYKVIEAEADRIGSTLCILPAEYISTQMMLRNRVGLNELSYKAAISMVRRVLDAGVNVAELYVDAVGDCDQYTKRLQYEFPTIEKIVVVAKADALYKVVGAASIFAKVTRDTSLEDWIFRENYARNGKRLAKSQQFAEVNCTGYPGDPATQQWLKENGNFVFGYPSIVRFSWGTTRRLLGEDLEDGTLTAEEKRQKEQEILLNNRPAFAKVEYEDLDSSDMGSLGLFLAKNKTGLRPKYFKERELHHVCSF